jgi:hypothetical protein
MRIDRPQKPKPARRKKPPLARRNRVRAGRSKTASATGQLVEELARIRSRLVEIEAGTAISDEFVAAQEQAPISPSSTSRSEDPRRTLPRRARRGAETHHRRDRCEELAIFERRGDTLYLVKSFGLSPRNLAPFPWEEAPSVARSRRSRLPGRAGRPPPRDEEELTAVIPLRVGSEVAGDRLFRLLGHKSGIVESDQAVFDLLSAHAGLALHLRRPDASAAG